MPDHDAPEGLETSSGLGLSSADSPLQRPSARPGAPISASGIAPDAEARAKSPSAALPSNPEEPPGWVENLGWLPLGYNDDRLVCLPRDPTCAFVYWDLSQDLIDESFAGLSSPRAQLKLIDETGIILRELEIDLGMRGFYLRDLPPGSAFHVELWALADEGARLLLRSAGSVQLPPAEASPVLEEQYLHLWLDSPLSGSTLEGQRPQLWRAASDFPGWVAAGAPGPEMRLGYSSSFGFGRGEKP